MQPNVADHVTTILHLNLVDTARRRLGEVGLDVQGAEDLAQDAWIRMLERRGPLHLVDPIRAHRWLNICVRRIAQEHLQRKGGLRGADALDVDPEPLLA